MENNPYLREKGAIWLSLFTSGSTLICCALPALFVALGAGAAFSTLLSWFPQLIWLGENKNSLFAVAGIMIALAWAARYYGSQRLCPTDPKLAALCMQQRKISGILLSVSAGIYLLGGTFAYLLPLLLV